MSNSRSIRRSIARHPVNVWRAKKKAAEQAAEAAKAKEPAFVLTPPDIEKIKAAQAELPSGLVFGQPVDLPNGKQITFP